MSHSLERKQKEAIGRRYFNISSSEKLIDHLSCKYKSKISASGALWIFKWHFCYYSNLFGTETKIRIRISDIAKISPSGNSSIEIVCIKNNETHKFVGFPSKERRDTVVQFIINQQIQYKKTVAAAAQSQDNNSMSISSQTIPQTPNKVSINNVRKSVTSPVTRPKSSSISRSHSHSVEDISQIKSEENIQYKTAQIHPKPTPPLQPAPTIKPKSENKEQNVATNNVNTIGNGIHGNDNNNNLENISKLKNKTESISPARFLHPSQQQIVTQKSRGRRKSSGGINYNNPPTFRLQSIHSQHSLQLITPQINDNDSDSDNIDEKGMKIDSKLKRQLSNKDSGSGMDTLDIFNLERSLSIHSDDTHQNRLRSWSDSDMPLNGSPTDSTKRNVDDKDDGKHIKSPFGGGWLSIFHTKTKGASHTKQNKRKNALHNASSSLGTIPKQPPKHAAPKVNRTRSTQDPERDLPKVDNNFLTSKSLPPEESNEEKEIMPSSLTQYIDESYALTPIYLGSFQNLEWKPLYNDDFWTTPALLFHEAFSEEFIKNMHHTRGSIGLKIGEWNIDDDDDDSNQQPITYVRKVEYISKIKDPPPFMPAKTEVYETQRFRFYGQNICVVDVVISTPNIKYGDYFLICQRYIFTINENENNKTHMDCSIAFKWVKKTWFEKIITSKATSEAEEGMAMWSGKLQQIFQPKISKQEMFVRKISNNELLNGVTSPRRKRIIDKKVIDYFHTPRKRKDIIINDWLKPIGQIIIDLIKIILNPNQWIGLYKNLLQINDQNYNDDNLINIKHGLMGIILIVGLFIMCNVCWFVMYYWYTSSLNNIIRQQNQILKQQTEVFEQLLNVLKMQLNDNNND